MVGLRTNKNDITANVPRVCVGRFINANFYEMKHTEKYLQAKWVTENPDGYDERDVVDAKRYCNAYLDGYNQALRIHDVSNRRELLCAFFKYFRDNGEANIGMTIEDFVDGFLSTQ